jgi:tyrosyl-tRNA synthetase
MANFIEELRWRGQLHQFTPTAEKLLSENKISGYCGFDPTATSLTMGNFVPIILLMRFQQFGHTPLALVGGATGLIGDPSGKSAERSLLNEDTLQQNVAAIQKQLSQFLDFETGTNKALLVNNYDWFKDMNVFTFLRDIGKHLTLNYMMAKDSVQTRLDNGISFTEFSYQLIQGYDFYWLWKNKNCQLQMAGSDQWGNMTTGMELIRRIGGGQADLVTCPLVTNADGSKMGKTEKGALWLDPNLTSPYEFYQYWLNTADEDVLKYCKAFTFLNQNTINELNEAHLQDTSKRIMQKALAQELTTLVHKTEAYQMALKTSAMLFGKPTPETFTQLQPHQWAQLFKGLPQYSINQEQLQGNIVALLAEHTSICPSKSEAKKLIQGGGLAINLQKISDVNLQLSNDHLLQNKYLVVQSGKKNFHLIAIN